MKVQRPPKLKKNSKVAVISPSSNPDHVGIKIGIDILKKSGLRVELGDTTRKLMTVGTLAATDKARADDFNWAFEDDTVDGVLCATGGYGSMRILDLLDFDMIKDHPKPFMGFSDITGYHMALNQLCGMVTFHGPLVDIDPSKGEEFIKDPAAMRWIEGLQRHLEGILDEVIFYDRGLSGSDLCNSYLAFCMDNTVGIDCDTSCVGD